MASTVIKPIEQASPTIYAYVTPNDVSKKVGSRSGILTVTLRRASRSRRKLQTQGMSYYGHMMQDMTVASILPIMTSIGT